MTKTKPGKIYFVTPVAYMPLDNKKNPELVVCLLPDLIEAQKKHQEEIATTRRETVEEIRKFFIDKNNEIVGDNQFMESKYSFSQIMNTLDQLPDKQEA